jgi:site-specific DNA-methyltransferase (adenine-specific)
MSVHFSSETDLWSTPQETFDNLNKVFNFKLDPCATVENAKCENFFTKEDDGLSKDWAAYGNVFMNPPYGREIGKWVHKAYTSGACVVCLLPARTDTKWWNDNCNNADVIKFIKGRLRFGDSKNSAPFPSAIVIFNLFNSN